MEITEKTDILLGYLEQRDIRSITVIDLTGLTGDMDEFIIGTAANERNARSCAEYLREKSSGEMRLIGMEGYDDGKWILADYGDIIVHIFIDDERRRYDLEKLWADGKFLTKRANEVNENKPD